MYFMTHFKNRYRIFHTESDSDLPAFIIQSLDHGIQLIEKIFDTPVDIPFINVFLCPSREIFDQFVRLFTRVPTDRRRIGQPQGHDVYMLSPKCYKNDAPSYARDMPPFYDEQEFKHNLVHELAHVWEELSSPRGAMDIRPGWFSEGLAMYVSQSYTEPEFMVRLKDDYEKGNLPLPDELTGQKAYTWGCLLFEFLIRRFGAQKILSIITDTCEEDIISLLDSDSESIRKEFMEFAKGRIDNSVPSRQ